MRGKAARRIALALAASGAALTAAPATACGSSQHFKAYIHSALPTPLPRGVIVADVEFEEGRFATGVRARIRKMIQGEYRGDTLIARTEWTTSCTYPFTNGRSGLIVAVPRSVEGGLLVVEPIEAGREDGFRLPDGWQLGDGDPAPAPDQPAQGDR